MDYSKSFYDEFLSACQIGHIQRVNSFIKKGLDINYKTKDGKTPLSIAITYNQIEVLKALLDHNVVIPEKCQYSSRKKESFVAVLFEKSNQLECLSLLLKYQPNAQALNDKNLMNLILNSMSKNKSVLFECGIKNLKNKEKNLDKILNQLDFNYHFHYPNFVPKVRIFVDLLLDLLIDYKINPEVSNAKHRLSILVNPNSQSSLSKLEQMTLSQKINEVAVNSKKIKI